MKTLLVLSSPNVEIKGKTLRIRDRVLQEDVIKFFNRANVSYWTGYIRDVLVIRPARRYTIVVYNNMYVIKEA